MGFLPLIILYHAYEIFKLSESDEFLNGVKLAYRIMYEWGVAENLMRNDHLPFIVTGDPCKSILEFVGHYFYWPLDKDLKQVFYWPCFEIYHGRWPSFTIAQVLYFTVHFLEPWMYSVIHGPLPLTHYDLLSAQILDIINTCHINILPYKTVLQGYHWIYSNKLYSVCVCVEDLVFGIIPSIVYVLVLLSQKLYRMTH